MTDSTGRTLGQYEILELMGRGGMAKDPMARYPSAGELAADLSAAALPAVREEAATDRSASRSHRCRYLYSNATRRDDGGHGRDQASRG